MSREEKTEASEGLTLAGREEGDEDQHCAGCCVTLGNTEVTLGTSLTERQWWQVGSVQTCFHSGRPALTGTLSACLD